MLEEVVDDAAVPLRAAAEEVNEASPEETPVPMRPEANELALSGDTEE